MKSLDTFLGENRDIRPLSAKLRMPVLVVEGEKTNVPLDATRMWATSLPNGRLLLIPNAGHFNFIEQPQIFFPAAEHFLQRRFPKEAQIIRAQRLTSYSTGTPQ